MKHKVTKKQTVSHNCFICGEQNPAGLKMTFYETESKELVGFFKGEFFHQSYPDRMHGGVISAILDETIGRAIEIYHSGMLGVTMELTVKYRKPVPLGKPLRCIGRIDKEQSRTFCASGKILDENGEILASATGTFLKIKADKDKINPLLSDELFLSEISENKDFIEY